METSSLKKTQPRIINEIDVEELENSIQEVARNSEKGLTRWRVSTSWVGGARSKTQVDSCDIGGQTVKKDFQIYTDEPLELGGTNKYPNPQETLMAAFNSCMMVGYVTLCSLEGIEISELRIETDGDIDLRGLFALDPQVKPGYDEIHYRVHLKGNGTKEQFQKIHETVMATSPNRFNIANPIRLVPELVLE